MELYISIGISIFILALFDTIISNKYSGIKSIKRLLFVITSILAILFVGFREDCGFDYDSYFSLFMDFDSENWFSNAIINGVEFGYAFLNYILGDFRYLLLFMAFTTITLMFSFIYKYSPLPFISLFLLLGVIFYPSFMGQYRQGLAISLVLWAFVIKEESKLKSLLIIILASTFHSTAFIGLLALFLPNKFYSIRIYLLILLVALVSNLTLKSFFLSISDLLPTQMSGKIDDYENAEELIVGINLAMLIRIIVLAIFLFYKNKLSNFKYGPYLVNLYFLSIIIYLGFGFLSQISIRGSLYFYFIEFILAPMLIFKTVGLQRILLFTFFLGISIYRQISFFTEWSINYIPYHNVLFSILGL